MSWIGCRIVKVENILLGGDEGSVDLGNAPHVPSPLLEFILAKAPAHSLVREALMLGKPNHCVARQRHPPPATFTKWQGQYLAFIHACTKVNRKPPAEADMQRYFRVTPPTVHQMVLNPHRARLIERIPGKPRSIRVLVSPDDLPALE